MTPQVHPWHDRMLLFAWQKLAEQVEKQNHAVIPILAPSHRKDQDTQQPQQYSQFTLA